MGSGPGRFRLFAQFSFSASSCFLASAMIDALFLGHFGILDVK